MKNDNSCDCPYGDCDCGWSGECHCDICTGNASPEVRAAYGAPPETIRAFIRIDKGHVLAPEFLRIALRAAYPNTCVTVTLSAKDADDDLIDDAPAHTSPYYSEYKRIRNESLGECNPELY